MNILIIDDSRDFRALLRLYLSKELESPNIEEYDIDNLGCVINQGLLFRRLVIVEFHAPYQLWLIGQRQAIIAPKHDIGWFKISMHNTDAMYGR